MSQVLKPASLSATHTTVARFATGRWLAVVLVGGSLVFGAWHYWALVTGLREAKSEILEIRSELANIDADVTPAQLAQAQTHADRADRAVARARVHFHRDPLLRVARLLPVAGPQVKATGDLIEMAGLTVDIAQEATRAGQEFTAIRDSRPAPEPLAETLVRAIEQTSLRVDAIDRLSRELVDRRMELGDRALLPPLASARDRLDVELPTLANAVERMRASYDVIPGLLGFEGERRYLVLALNSGELLPGGGLVSAAGILPVIDGETGEVDFADSTRWKWDWEAKGGAYIPPPGPLRRYLLRDYTWNLLVSNWNPDFPTWSQQAKEFYELVHGEQDIDGIVAMDLEVLRRLLAITGPQTLEVEGYGQVTFTSDNAVLELERLTRQSFDKSEDRKSVIGDLAQSLLQEIMLVPSDRWGELIDIVQALGAERHIQVLSFDSQEQAVVRDAGWSGQLRETDGDYVHFNEASLNSTKLNLIIQPQGEYSIDVSALGDARHTLSLHYANTLPDWQQGRDPKLVKQLMLGGVYGGYLRVIGPASMMNWSATNNGAPMSIEDTADEGGRRWFGVFMPLPAGATADPTLQWVAPMATRAAGAKEYELLIQKQPGTPGMCLKLTVTREGQPPTRLDVTGGRRDSQDRVCLTTDVTAKAVWK